MAAFALPPAVSAHAIKLALVHDLAEALVGDITPRDGVSGEEKERRERAAMATVRDEVLQGEGALGKHLVDLWEEYEAGETEAARLVKDVDKYEMIVQAYEYEGCTLLWVCACACAGYRRGLVGPCVPADEGGFQVGPCGTAPCPCALRSTSRLGQPAAWRASAGFRRLTPVAPRSLLMPAFCAMPLSTSLLLSPLRYCRRWRGGHSHWHGPVALFRLDGRQIPHPNGPGVGRAPVRRARGTASGGGGRGGRRASAAVGSGQVSRRVSWMTACLFLVWALWVLSAAGRQATRSTPPWTVGGSGSALPLASSLVGRTTCRPVPGRRDQARLPSVCRVSFCMDPGHSTRFRSAGAPAPLPHPSCHHKHYGLVLVHTTAIGSYKQKPGAAR